ncbi:MAG TPA: C40 family peptidase [Burkholderiales bacterium]|nr:C40 family peptidase [Burkholderiales bacterium]
MKSTALLLSLFLLASCASEPREGVAYAAERNPADRAAANAAGMIGKPYRYGGASPTGFDCSGLIQFSYKQAGVSLPRDTTDQRRATQRVKLAEVQPGDLIFFDQRGRKNSHVGIYLGERRFVHAPSSGKHVRNDSLDNPYWKKHLSEVRRPSA